MRETPELKDTMSKCNQKTSTEHSTQILQKKTTTTFCSESHRTYSKTEHISRHRSSLNKSKGIEITPCILSDHNGLIVGINSEKNHRKYPNSWKQNSIPIKQLVGYAFPLRTDKAIPNTISEQLQLPALSLHKTWPVNSQSAKDP